MDNLRKHAEETLQEDVSSPEEYSPETMKTLIHELQVHQVELEMQNEELRHINKELQASRSRYADLYNFAPAGHLTLNEKGGIIEANLRCEELFGRNRADLFRCTMAHLLHTEDEDVFYLHRRKMRESDLPQTFELRMRRKDDTLFYAHLKCVPVRKTDEHPPHIRIAITDISTLKHTEEQLRLALNEVHHRTKNNMAVIDSLLAMQSEKIDDPQVRNIFRDAQSRIQSMSLVHTKLYRSDLTRVDMQEYLEDLALTLRDCYQMTPGQIALALETEQVYLPISQAVPCGLLLNELITNALKYAFPKGRPGKISIGLRETEGHIIELWVRDNGEGLPDNFESGQINSVGMDIIKSIARHQFRGTVEFNRLKLGTEVMISFPRELPRKN